MLDLPTGIITLLFTDIEGSTPLLEQLSERYPDVLAEYRSLLRTAFHAHDGHEVDTQGDSFFAAFARATDAVSAAVEVQRTLFAHAWPNDVKMRVRIGLHTGEPQLSTEGYVGLDVHHAARIMSAGHGGQVLLSQPTCDLVAHCLPEGVVLRDLGEHRLKDLQRASHLYQLVIPGIPSNFPPLKTLDIPPHNLPVQLTSLIGRKQEIATIQQLLQREDVRLLTLTGTGGTGKTRLALQVAAELSDLFLDGVYFVNLAPISNPALVVSTIAQTLNIKEVAGQSLLDLLKGSLHWKRLLLLLDNFEQVVDAAVDVAGLLVVCPNLKVLVTSRMPLHVRGEQEFAVPPLALPDLKHVSDLMTLSQYEAVALFLARAQAVKPDFQMTNASAPAIAEICIRLDGLPLAIELAAARVKLLPPQALLAWLGQRLAVLTSGARDAPTRQQTLRNTIKWSYDLLDAQEQKLFRWLSVFVGGCTLEAIEAVCYSASDEKTDILDRVSLLIDKSLLQQIEQEGKGPRLVMLEMIREYGLEMLTVSGEMELVRQAHAEFYLQLAEQAEPELKGSAQIEWLERLEQEHANLRAALEWLLGQGRTGGEPALRLGCALKYFWVLRGHSSEGRAFLEQALATRANVGSSLRARALLAAGLLAHIQVDYARAEALFQESLALARDLDEPHCIVEALQHLGVTLCFRDFNRSCALLEEALPLARDLGDPWFIAWSVFLLGIRHAMQQDHTAARSLLEESLALSRKIGNPWRIADSLRTLAGEISEHDPERARTLLEEALALVRDIGDKRGAAMSLLSLGDLALEQGEITSAQSLLEEALRSFKELGEMQGIANTLLLLGELATTQGNYMSAHDLYEESLALANEPIIQDPQMLAAGLEGLAEVVAAQGEPIWAARIWSAAIARREATGYPPTPYNPARHKRAVAATCAQIGEQAFAVAWAEGRTMTLEQVLAKPEPKMMFTTSQKEPATPPKVSTFATYPDTLTAREVEVLRLVAQGLTNDQVAEQLVISPRTVNTHLTSIYSKIGVTSRSAATRYTIEHHLV